MRMLRSSSVVRTMGGRRSYIRLSLNLGKMRFESSVSTAPGQALQTCDSSPCQWDVQLAGTLSGSCVFLTLQVSREASSRQS